MNDKLKEIWGQYLREWLKSADYTHDLLAEKVLVKVEHKESDARTIRNWCNGKNIPSKRHLISLIKVLAELKTGPKTEQQLIAPAELLDWLALVGYTSQDVMGLGLDETVKKYLGQALPVRYPYPQRNLPVPYVKRAITGVLIGDLTKLASYRQPQYRVVMAHGQPGSGKTTLAVKAIQAGEIRARFRSGIIWIDGSDKNWAESAGLQIQDIHGSDRPVEMWWTWIKSNETVGLVILNDLMDRNILGEILDQAGPQVQFLITTSDSERLQPVMSGQLNEEWVRKINVGGLTIDEGTELVQELNAVPSAEDAQYLEKVMNLISRPGPLRILAAEARNVGWERAWQWIWDAYRTESPMSQKWTDFYDHAWKYLDKTNQRWLVTLAGSIPRGGDFGPVLAAIIWQISEQSAQSRLQSLELRGWLSKVDEMPTEIPQKIRQILGSPRYMFSHSVWQFVRYQDDEIETAQRHRLVQQLEQKLKQIYHPPVLVTALYFPVLLAGFIRFHVLRWRHKDSPPPFKNRQMERLEEVWKRVGLQPPSEVSLIADHQRQTATSSGRWVINLATWILIGLILMLGFMVYLWWAELTSVGFPVIGFAPFIAALLVGLVMAARGFKNLAWLTMLLLDYDNAPPEWELGVIGRRLGPK